MRARGISMYSSIERNPNGQGRESASLGGLDKIYRKVYYERMNEKSNSKEAILEAALILFSERGYDAVGVSEIVQTAGITKPTLYYFFQSKEGLLQSIMELYYSRFLELLEEACQYHPHPENYHADVFPVLVKTAETIFSYARYCPHFYTMLLSLRYAPPLSVAYRVIYPYWEKQERLLLDLFVAIANSHPNLRRKEQQDAESFLSIIHRYAYAVIRGVDVPDAATASRIVRRFMHGIFI